MLNPTSFVRLLVTAAAVLPLTVTALPGVDPVSNRRGGAKLSSYHGNNSTSTPILVRDASAGGACNTAADCGSDAPMCEFPWVFEPSPYNQPQRVCMLSINYQGCNSDSQCTTHNCITGADQPICFPDDGGCTANSCPQIPTTDMRCSNGVSLEGFCLIAGNNPCTESAECSSGTCQANNFCAKDNVLGLPAPNDYTCGSNFRPTSFSYVASTELADGSFAISPIFYNYRYCGWNDQNAICSQNSECKSGLCLVSAYNDGEKRCGMGADIARRWRMLDAVSVWVKQVHVQQVPSRRRGRKVLLFLRLQHEQLQQWHLRLFGRYYYHHRDHSYDHDCKHCQRPIDNRLHRNLNLFQCNLNEYFHNDTDFYRFHNHSCVHQHIDLHFDNFYVYLYVYLNDYYYHTEALHHDHFRVDRFDVQAQLVDHINYLESYGLKHWHDDDVQEQHQ
ncbi:unnamed protein product [Tilletia controversa]|nr:unnamed protein product [Tilletia controversa]CAD6971023.1 unnamed protein product [Tilletia controversa]